MDQFSNCWELVHWNFRSRLVLQTILEAFDPRMVHVRKCVCLVDPWTVRVLKKICGSGSADIHVCSPHTSDQGRQAFYHHPVEVWREKADRRKCSRRRHSATYDYMQGMPTRQCSLPWFNQCPVRPVRIIRCSWLVFTHISSSTRSYLYSNQHHSYCNYYQYTGWVKKSSPPTTFNDIFARAESFCIKFCTFIGNLYPHMCTDFRLFILKFNEMALTLSRSPIIFTVSSLDCSAGNKNAEFQLNGKDVIGQWSRFNCRLS